MPQLNPEFFASQIFWLLIVFGLIYLLVAKYFLPRVGSVVELRSSKIEEDIILSEKMIAEYKALEIKSAKTLEKARHDSFAIIESASKKAQAQIADKVSVIEKEISKSTAKKEENLARIKTQVNGEIEKVAVDIANEISAQLISKLDFEGK